MITAQMIHEAFTAATQDTWKRDWSEVDGPARARYEAMAAQLNRQADQHYMSEVLRTCVAEDFHERLLLGALGLAGEAGEVVDLVKKMHFQGHTIDTEQVKDELGDVMWYIALLCHSLDLSLGDILQANVAKMHRRYPDGFEVERSVNR